MIPVDEARRPAYWAVIPAGVRYDPELPPNAKLLYAEISALADSRGFCWASNGHLGKLFGLTPRTVQGLTATLAEHGYIAVEVVRDDKGEVVERRLWIDRPLIPDPPHEKIFVTPHEKNFVENNTRNLPLPPIVPQPGDVPAKPQPKKRAPKAAPVWKPGRFAGFWKTYPRGEDKQAAIRAWDRLKPSDATIDAMGPALLRQIAASENPRRYMPYASTWLNGRRWEDEDKAPVVGSSSGWGEDREVL